MAFDDILADRIRQNMDHRTGATEKTMFGGIGFLLHGNMCVGVWKDSMIARLGPEQAAEALKTPHVGEFDITGKPMKGWVLIGPKAVANQKQLDEWIELAVKFVKTLPVK
jgi:TfoX/Sxy family transcriptional regulator of competence genes